VGRVIVYAEAAARRRRSEAAEHHHCCIGILEASVAAERGALARSSLAERRGHVRRLRLLEAAHAWALERA
jgi:uncharacterized membrane protein